MAFHKTIVDGLEFSLPKQLVLGADQGAGSLSRRDTPSLGPGVSSQVPLREKLWVMTKSIFPLLVMDNTTGSDARVLSTQMLSRSPG